MIQSYPIEVKGLAALRQKEQQYFQQQVAEMHGGYCHEPVISSHFFACAQGMDVTLTGKGRKMKEQLGVFEVEAGKIVKEQFFYNDFA